MKSLGRSLGAQLQVFKSAIIRKTVSDLNSRCQQLGFRVFGPALASIARNVTTEMSLSLRVSSHENATAADWP